jgi:hypothetical protein
LAKDAYHGSAQSIQLCFQNLAQLSMQKPATMLLRMLLLVPLFVASFADGIERPDDVQLAYIIVLKLLACLALFAAGNVAKTLLAKLLASHVHRTSFFDKMQDALEKVLLPSTPGAYLRGLLSILYPTRMYNLGSSYFVPSPMCLKGSLLKF